MESKFKVGDLVWAKMKGFPAWPAKVIEPKEEVRRPTDKKPKKFVYFFGSENYAWIPQDCLWQYVTNKERFTLTHRIPRGFREAMEAVDDALKNLPEQGSIKTADLPSIDEELTMMFPTRSNTPVRHTYSGSKAKKYLQMQGRKGLRQAGPPTPPGVPDKRLPQVAKERLSSRRDRALKRRSSLDAIKNRQPMKRRRSQPESQKSALSRKSRSIGGAVSRARRKRVDARGDSRTVGEEEEEEVTLKRPNGGGDYLGGEEENGEVTPIEGSVTSEESEVTLRKPEAGDMVTQEDDDEVTLKKPDTGGNSDTEVKWDNGLEGECAEVVQSPSEGKIGDDGCSGEEALMGDLGEDALMGDLGEDALMGDAGVEVATEEVVEYTMNYDLTGGDEVVETTASIEDIVVGESTVDADDCDEQQSAGELSADECNKQQVEEISADIVEVEQSSADDVVQDIVASTIVQRSASVDTNCTDASVESVGAGGASCGTEEKDSDAKEVAKSGDEEPHRKLRARQEKEIKEVKDTQPAKNKKEEAKLKKIQDRKSREFQAAIRTKPPPRKRPLSSSPLSISSTITPKRSKLPPTKPLSSSARKANSLPSTAQNDLKPILEIMQQQSGKIARVSDTEDQDVTEDDYAECLADLSGIDFSLSNIPRTKNIIATPMKIGFLGLGAMGSGMVTNLLNSGHEVTVWNRTPSSCREFVKIGALKGNSPSEVITSCDMTFSCVSDPSALKDLVFGNCGVLQGIGPGKAYIDMSTVDVETITDVHEAVTTRGGRFLEAPVIGSRQPAMNGQLLILAAGDRTLFDDCYSCLEAMGRQTFFLGEVGSATKMKLVISMLMGTVLAGLAESMALAEHIGLDQEEVLKILTLSPVSCPLVRTKGNAMMQAQFSNPHCRLHLCQKDLRLAVNMSDTVEQPLHVASAVNELFKKAKAKGYGEHDSAAVYRAADL